MKYLIMKHYIIYGALVLLFLTGFPITWILCLINKRFPFLPNKGMLGNFFWLGVLGGAVVWVVCLCAVLFVIV